MIGQRDQAAADKVDAGKEGQQICLRIQVPSEDHEDAEQGGNDSGCQHSGCSAQLVSLIDVPGDEVHICVQQHPPAVEDMNPVEIIIRGQQQIYGKADLDRNQQVLHLASALVSPDD